GHGHRLGPDRDARPNHGHDQDKADEHRQEDEERPPELDVRHESHPWSPREIRGPTRIWPGLLNHVGRMSDSRGWSFDFAMGSGAGRPFRGALEAGVESLGPRSPGGRVTAAALRVVQAGEVLVAGRERVGIIEAVDDLDRKSTRLNSSHVSISYAVFCL